MSRRRIAGFGFVLVLMASPVFAQDAPKVGMSPWAFKFALAGQVADVVSTEVALAQGLKESNHLMTKRAVRVPLKLALPLVSRWFSRKLPRAQANANAILIGAWGFGPAAWNVTATVKFGK